MKISPSKTPQNIATIGIKYVTLDAKTDEVRFISKLKNQTANPVPTIPKIFINKKLVNCGSLWIKLFVKSVLKKRKNPANGPMNRKDQLVILTGIYLIKSEKN